MSSVVWKRGVILLILLVCAGGLLWVYARPPLTLKAVGVYRSDSLYFFDLDLANRGIRPVVLDRLVVNGSLLADSVVAVEGPATLRTGRSAVRLEDLGDQVRTGSVSGWRIDPENGSGTSHGVRVIWHIQPPSPQSIEVRYRYLGLPFRLRIGEEWLQ